MVCLRMQATINNNGEIGKVVEADERGRVTLGSEYAGETIEVSFEVQE